MHNTVTCESVTKGHVDKLADQVSDAVLDHANSIKTEEHVEAGINCLITGNTVVLTGEISSIPQSTDFSAVVRDVFERAGYTDPRFECEAKAMKVIDLLRHTRRREIGKATDQGIMYGYATNETPTCMPLAFVLAQKLTRALEDARERKEIPYLGPDGKSQVTVAYNKGKPEYITNVVVSAQHLEGISTRRVRSDIRRLIIDTIGTGPAYLFKDNIMVNPDEPYVFGGPVTDSGLTGRKLMVDTYGGVGRHGGGAFSGKDPTKLDRSGAYLARWVAKHIVKAELALEAEVAIGYAVNKKLPVSISVDTFETSRMPGSYFLGPLKSTFKFDPISILADLHLQHMDFLPLATGGHMGREDLQTPWEDTPRITTLKKYAAQYEQVYRNTMNALRRIN